MNILTDYHHSGLSYSFHLTLEKRLGHSVFRPIGMEWFERGFWDIAKPYGNNPETVKQFLSTASSYTPPDNTPALNTLLQRDPRRSHYLVDELYHGYIQKALSFKQFIDTDIDVIIASVPDHWYTYKRLRDQFKPKAKLICHMGNMFDELPRALQDGTIENLMASTIALPLQAMRPKREVLALNYYQEQPLVAYVPATQTAQISSYAHVLPAWKLYEQYKEQLQNGVTMKAYGAACPDGWMHTLNDLYENMRRDQFVWHVKPGGDGYGWNWHSAFMSGRPVITNFSDYKDKLGGKLFEDGVTGLDLEVHNFADNVQFIRDALYNGKAEEMGREARNRFNQYVNYNAQAKNVALFLDNLR